MDLKTYWTEEHFWKIFYYAGWLAFIYLVYYLWFVPLNFVKTVDQVGFAHVEGSGKRKRMWINRMRKSRKSGNPPPPFPNGWFVIAESNEIRKGDIKRVTALNKNFAVFRGEKSGKSFVTDVYCPHLGADITVGGRITGDCVKCPFHDWKFQGDSGKCVEIPYAEKVPEFASLKTYTSTEVNGCIYVWHHTEDLEPQWEVPIIPQCNPDIFPEEKQWIYHGRTELEIACHIQDIPENGADAAHLDAIHHTPVVVGGEPSKWLEDLSNKIMWHTWNINWRAEQEEGQKHVAIIDLIHKFRLFGKDVGKVLIRGEQIGPSFVHLYMESRIGKGVMIQYILPLEPMLQKIVHIFYTERTWVPPLGKLALYSEAMLLERDIAVWNSKTYMDRPLIVKEDNLILKHRRWYSQFYSERKNGKNGINRQDDDLNW